jgi:hypothetical protein
MKTILINGRATDVYGCDYNVGDWKLPVELGLPDSIIDPERRYAAMYRLIMEPRVLMIFLVKSAGAPDLAERDLSGRKILYGRISRGDFTTITFSEKGNPPWDISVEFYGGTKATGRCVTGELFSWERSMIKEQKDEVRRDRVMELLTERAELVEALLAEPPTKNIAGSPTTGAETVGMLQKGRLRFTPGFNDVWLGGEHYDLRKRRKARFCIEYLFEQGAFNEMTARHLEKEIDPYVRKKAGGLPPPNDIRIHHYFVDRRDSRRRLEKLRKELIQAAGRNGRFYLTVD